MFEKAHFSGNYRLWHLRKSWRMRMESTGYRREIRFGTGWTGLNPFGTFLWADRRADDPKTGPLLVARKRWASERRLDRFEGRL